MLINEIKILRFKTTHHLSTVFQNGVQIDNAEDLDVVMPMYNLLEYSKNYRKITDSLWNNYRSNPLCLNSECFKYKASIVGKTPESNDSLMNAKVVIPLKHLRSFWRALNRPSINCAV